MLGRIFRTRSPNRDRAADEARWAGVAEALKDALEAAKRERDGLQKRYGQVQSNAAFLYEDDTAEQKPLGAMENELLAAESRLVALTHQIGLFEELSDTTDRLRQSAMIDSKT